MAQAPRLRGQHAIFYEKVIRRRKPTRSDPNRVTSSHWCCDWSRGRDPETGKPRRQVFYFATRVHPAGLGSLASAYVGGPDARAHTQAHIS
jgi:hypothetical protein